MEDSIVAAVIQKFKQRSETGIKKYGKTLDRDDLSPADWIQHAQEEHMDAILYLEKLKKELSKNEVEKACVHPFEKVSYFGRGWWQCTVCKVNIEPPKAEKEEEKYDDSSYDHYYCNVNKNAEPERYPIEIKEESLTYEH